MNLVDILPRLSGVRKGGNGYMAKCPAHQDNHQSLSIAESDGRILLNCFAGCNANDVVSHLGLKWHELFDKKIKDGPSYRSLGGTFRDEGTRRREASFYAPRRQRIQSVYQYRDEADQLVYENVRFHPKDFRQRHFDGTGREIWNLDGVRRVPYRLPQLLRCIRQGSDVFLCEGEKDTDQVRELNLTASNFKNWSADFNRYIQDANVIILMDHDLPGQKHAEEAARTISKAARSVKIVDVWQDLPLPEKQGPDISDYIRTCVQDEGMTREEIGERLAGMVENTAEWKDPREKNKVNLFIVKDGNQWLEEAKNTPIPKMLLGKLWYEGELCILFADTNVGKSILAVQAADAIARGASVSAPPDAAGGTGSLVNESKPQPVLYFDFELTQKQFEARFAEEAPGSEFFTNHYRFHPNFKRATINPDSTDLEGFDDFQAFLEHSLNETIVATGAKVLIVDNLTYLRDETENAKNALALMKYLKALKEKYRLSILTLAHTPKRDSTRKLDVNDLQGSKMLINFCDSSFAIGKSVSDVGLRYIKQIKARNTELIYHTDSVLLGHVSKESNFLRFEFFGIGKESELLKAPADKDKEQVKEMVIALAAEGKNQREIAEAAGISKATVCRYLKTVSETVS